MSATAATEKGSVSKLLDFLMDEKSLKNDAALAREMDVAPPVVSKWRRDTIPFGPKHILRAHEHFHVGVAEIRLRGDLH